jgi:MFS family permease
VFFAFIGGIVYFTAYFQQARGDAPIAAGLAILPIGVAYALGAGVSGRLVTAFGERWPLVVGLTVAGAAALGLLRLGPASPTGAIWWIFALLGAGIGLCGTPMNTIAMSAVGVRRAGMASAVINTMRQVGQVFGVAVLGALVYGAIPGGRVRTADDRARFVTGLHHALWVSGLALLATAAVTAALLFTRPGRRDDHSGRQQKPAATETETLVLDAAFKLDPPAGRKVGPRGDSGIDRPAPP